MIKMYHIDDGTYRLQNDFILGSVASDEPITAEERLMLFILG